MNTTELMSRLTPEEKHKILEQIVSAYAGGGDVREDIDLEAPVSGADFVQDVGIILAPFLPSTSP